MDAVERGQRAALILRDPVFEEAVTRIRQRVHDEWEDAMTVEQREIAWHRIRALAAIVQELFQDEQSGAFETAQQAKQDAADAVDQH